MPAILLSSGLIFSADLDPRHDPRARPMPTDKLGPFVNISGGRILAIDSAATFVSADGGLTWSEPRPVFTGGQNIKISNERAMMRTKEGTIIAAFMNLNERKWTWKNDLGDAPGAVLPTYVMRSLDEGKTWLDIQKMHDDWSGAVRDMIQTREGRIIFTAMKMQHHPGRHAILTYSSTDDGKTWKGSNLIDLGGAGNHGGVTEPTLTQLKSGRLWMLIRTNWSEFWSAYSDDGGQFWRVIQPSGIPASSAPGMLRRLASGRLMLLWNRLYPDGKYDFPLSGGDNIWSAAPVSNYRGQLSLAFSENEGKSWSKPIVLASSPDSSTKGSSRWVSYPYVFEKEPGLLWITTMQGGLRIIIEEQDFAGEKKAPEIVVAFGDSTTATRGKLKIYSELLREELPRIGMDAKVINAGIGGDTTALARTRFEKDVLDRNPDFVIIQFGINDAAVDLWKKPPTTKSRVSLADYQSNLRYFIKKLQSGGSHPILMTPNPLRWTEKTKKLYGKPPYHPDAENGFTVILNTYAEKVREIAEEEKVPLIDVYAEFERLEKTAQQSVAELLLDGIHPNDQGQQIVANGLLRYFQSVLPPERN